MYEFLLSTLCVCAHMHVCVHDMHMSTYGGQRSKSSSSFSNILLETEVLTGQRAHNSVTIAANKAQRSFCYALFQHWNYRYVMLLLTSNKLYYTKVKVKFVSSIYGLRCLMKCVYWGSELRSPHMCSKHLTTEQFPRSTSTFYFGLSSIVD